MVDPERFPDDEREVMADRGAEVISTRTSDGQALRGVRSSAARGGLLRRFYAPHHAALTRAVDAAIARHGGALVQTPRRLAAADRN